MGRFGNFARARSSEFQRDCEAALGLQGCDYHQAEAVRMATAIRSSTAATMSISQRCRTLNFIASSNIAERVR
jgi:hypothetical protein